MTATAAAPTYSSTFYAGPPPPPTNSTVRPEQQPPQLAYGWWVDVLPPRGPYLWPCSPAGYEIAQSISASAKHDGSNNHDGTRMDTAADGSSSSSSSSPPASFLSQPPQMAFGWYCAEPPHSGPFFWSCLPPGYQLVPSKQWEQMLSTSKQTPQLTTTRQGNVTLTLPNSSASLAAQLAASAAAAAAAASTPSSSPLPILPLDSLSAPSSTLSLSNFYPASKTQSISNLLASPPPHTSQLASDSLSFLNLSQSQERDDTSASSSAVVPPMPSRSPALEGLAAIAGGSDFKLDSLDGGVGASLGSVGEGEEDGVGEEDEHGGARRGKRKRTIKGR